MFNDTVTLFNRYYSPTMGRETGNTWYATVLHNVHVNMDRAAIIAKYGAETDDSAMLNVHYERREDGIYIDGKKWLPPIEWDKQPNDDYANTITFTPGTYFDFWIVGEWDGESPVFDKDYETASNFYEYLRDTRDNVFAITSVGGPYSVIPHFEITGR